jgi:hypothetical protein
MVIMRNKMQELAYELAQEIKAYTAKYEHDGTSDLKDSAVAAYGELAWQCGKLADGNFHEVVQEANRK